MGRLAKEFRDLKATFKGIEVVVTVSVFNVHLLDEILHFFTVIEGVNCSLNYVYNPSNLSITQISPKAKEYIRTKYAGQSKFKKVIEFMDSKHNENFLDVPMLIHEKDLNVMHRKLYKDYTPFYLISGEWMKLLKEK